MSLTFQVSPVKKVESFCEDEKVALFVVKPHSSPFNVRSSCVPAQARQRMHDLLELPAWWYKGDNCTGEHALTTTTDRWGLNALSELHTCIASTWQWSDTGCFSTHSVQGQPIKELVHTSNFTAFTQWFLPALRLNYPLVDLADKAVMVSWWCHDDVFKPASTNYND